MGVIKTKQKGEGINAFVNSIAVANAGYLGGKAADSYYNLGVPNKIIPSDIAKLSDITEYGVYTSNEHNLQYYEDCPKDIINNSNGFVLVVHNSTNEARAFQELYVTNIVNSHYYRFNYNGVYEDFKRIAHTDNISNPALNINPDFRINQRATTYHVPIGTNIYSDSNCKNLDKTATSQTTVTIETNRRYAYYWDGTVSANRFVKLGDVVGYEVTTQMGRPCDGYKVIQIADGDSVIWKANNTIDIKSTDWLALVQDIEIHDHLLNTPLTISAMVDGQLYSFTTSNNGSESKGQSFNVGDGKIGLTISTTSSYFRVQFSAYQVSCNLEYIKLEKGSVATPLSPLKPSEALAECQRYYLPPSVFRIAMCSGVTNQLYFDIELPYPMRTKPTIVSYTIGNIRGDGVLLDVNNATLSTSSFSNNRLALIIHGLDKVANKVFWGSITIELSAEL